MGQNVNPVGLRLGINRGWDSVWYAKKKDFGNNLIEDFRIREYIKKNVVNSGVSKVMIERTTKKCFVTIYTSRPGFVIGKKGTDIEKIKGNLSKLKKQIDSKIVKSVNKNVRSSTRKLNPLLKSIVGKKVDIAIRNLTFSEKRISKDIKKTISSAVANAENNYQYDIDKLIIKEAYCGKQVVMKRFRARAKGRAAEIMKPYSNLTIILTEKIKQTESHGTKGLSGRFKIRY